MNLVLVIKKSGSSRVALINYYKINSVTIAMQGLWLYKKAILIKRDFDLVESFAI